jgi:hypothetical protein
MDCHEEMYLRGELENFTNILQLRNFSVVKAGKLGRQMCNRSLDVKLVFGKLSKL